MPQLLRFLPLIILCTFASSCSWFSSQDTQPTRIVTNPLDTSTGFARSVSLLKEFDRIATMNLATSFSWWDSTGNIHQLSESYGRVMAIYFWNDTQPWSVNTAIELLRAKAALKDSDVVYVGVLVGKGKDSSAVWKAQRILDSIGVSFQQVIGNSELNYAYGGINTMPTLFVINRNGKVHQKLEGQQTSAQFEAALRKALSYVPLR